MSFLPPPLYPFLKTLGCAFIQLTPELTIKEFNREAEHLYGCTEKIAIGKNFIQLCSNAGVAPPLQDFHAALSEDKVIEVIQVFSTHPIIKQVQWIITPVFDNKNSAKIASILLIGIDKNILLNFENIEEKVKNFECIINNVPHSIFWKDKNSVFLGCNEKFAQLAKLKSAKEIVGKTDYDLPWGEQESAAYIKDDQFVIQTRKAKLNIEESLTTDNEKSFLLTSKVPLYGIDGELSGVLGIFTDITELKKIEEKLQIEVERAEASSRAKSKFIANMSHDIRTPITGIIGLVRDLKNIAKTTKKALTNIKLSDLDRSRLIDEFIARVENNSNIVMCSVDELLQLCNEILEMSRLEKGILTDDLESFDIRQLVQHNLVLLEPVAQHKKLDLSVDIYGTIPKYIKGFRSYLDRILLNIMSNALKFTDTGFVKVTIQLLDDVPATYQKGDKITLQFAIEDTGIGIDKEHFKTIFEHFSRLNPSYEGTYKGFGLGLYTVKQYIEAMGGSIEVSSEPGKGTCFLITAPFTVSDQADRPSEPIQQPRSVLKLPKPRSALSDVNTVVSSEPASCSILIVEDSAPAAMAVSLVLKESGCAIDIAENGARAIEKATQGAYDLIFMDIGLPDMTGIDVTKAIRSFADTQKSQVPIVALTGHADDAESRKECLQAGMQDVLSKPAQPLLLQSILQQFVFHSADKTLSSDESVILSAETTSHLPIIDWETSVNMCGGYPDRARGLLSLLSEDLKKTQDIFAASYLAKDTRALRDVLHRTLGGVVYLRLPQLEHALRTFHHAVKAEPLDWNECERRYRQMQEAIKVFLSEAEAGGFESNNLAQK